MKFNKKFMWSTPLVACAVAIAVMAFSGSPTKTVDAIRGGGGSGCEGDIKVEGPGGDIISAPHGQSIAYICVKAGQNVVTFYPGDHGDGCYKVEWDGTCRVRVKGGGTSRDCKEISHVAVTLSDEDCKKDHH